MYNLCREVNLGIKAVSFIERSLSFSRRVLYRRFHCIVYRGSSLSLSLESRSTQIGADSEERKVHFRTSSISSSQIATSV